MLVLKLGVVEPLANESGLKLCGTWVEIGASLSRLVVPTELSVGTILGLSLIRICSVGAPLFVGSLSPRSLEGAREGSCEGRPPDESPVIRHPATRISSNWRFSQLIEQSSVGSSEQHP